MRQPGHEEHIGGKAAHVGDCFVWAEIYYLDSPTDYREYLPNYHPPVDSQLVMLDDILPTRPAARIWFSALRSVALIFSSVAIAAGQLLPAWSHEPPVIFSFSCLSVLLVENSPLARHTPPRSGLSLEKGG